MLPALRGDVLGSSNLSAVLKSGADGRTFDGKANEEAETATVTGCNEGIVILGPDVEVVIGVDDEGTA